MFGDHRGDFLNITPFLGATNVRWGVAPVVRQHNTVREAQVDIFFSAGVT